MSSIMYVYKHMDASLWQSENDGMERKLESSAICKT